MYFQIKIYRKFKNALRLFIYSGFIKEIAYITIVPHLVELQVSYDNIANSYYIVSHKNSQ